MRFGSCSYPPCEDSKNTENVFKQDMSLQSWVHLSLAIHDNLFSLLNGELRHKMCTSFSKILAINSQ